MNPTPDNTPLPSGGSWCWDDSLPGWMPSPPPAPGDPPEAPSPTPDNTPLPGGGSWGWDESLPGWVPSQPPAADDDEE